MAIKKVTRKPKTAVAKKKTKPPTKAKAVKKSVTKTTKKTPAKLKKAAVKKQVSAKIRNIKPEKLPSFSSSELERFRDIINQKRKETYEELELLKATIMDVTTGEYVSENSTYSLHMEQGTDAMEREKTFLFASRGNKFLIQLDDAIARIEDETYGRCRTCQLLVPKERLEAVPTAQTCAEFKNTGIPCERGKQAIAKRKKREG